MNEKINVYVVQLAGRMLLSGVDRIENTLESKRKLLGCRLVEPVDVQIDGKDFTIWADEEGKLTPHPVLNVFLGDLEKGCFDVICGPCLFTRTGPDGKTLGLNEEDVRSVEHFLDDAHMKLRKAISMKLI